MLDGCNCLTYDEFDDEVIKVFQLPDYYGRNTHALDECINDLDWIDAESYTLVLRSYDKFFSNEVSISYEQKREARKIYLKIFCQAKYEWANVPNHPGEDKYRKRKIFDVYIEKSGEVVDLLSELGVAWKMFQEKPNS